MQHPKRVSSGVRSTRAYVAVCQAVVHACAEGTDVEVQRRLLVSRGKVRYWRRKSTDPSFHPGPMGGAHNFRFDEPTERLVHLVLWQEIQADPLRTAQQLTVLLVCDSISLLWFFQLSIFFS
jgi:hypothetical protein